MTERWRGRRKEGAREGSKDRWSTDLHRQRQTEVDRQVDRWMYSKIDADRLKRKETGRQIAR